MVADGDSTVYPAAHFCNNLSIGGKSDWYFPAKNELEVCYFNLKPTTDSNVTNSGINPNAVPARASNYTAGNPAQTSASVFQAFYIGGSLFPNAEAFGGGTYSSSTETSNTERAMQDFDSSVAPIAGRQVNASKTFLGFVRAVRRVAV